MARDETMGSRLRQGVLRLPTKQNPYSSPKDPTLPYHHRTPNPTVPTGLHGPHHRPTPDSRPRCDTNHRRPRVLSKRHILTLFHHYHRGGNRPTVPRTCVPMVWPSNQTNHRPRPTFHVTLRKGANHATRHPTKSIHGLPPSN